MRTIEWDDGIVKMIDQRQLPHKLEIAEFDDYRDVANAITEMYIRGAPAIGAAAAFGFALASLQSDADTFAELQEDLQEAYDVLYAARPTAVNLRWALDRLMHLAYSLETEDVDAVREALVEEAKSIAEEDVQINMRMGENGATLVPQNANILHHCNTGGLATVDWGTALGVIRSAHEQKKNVHVWVDETRPRLQGARLTAWELKQWGVPQTVVADNAAGYLMRSGKVDLVMVGADRVAANGDVANKIGTYKLAVVANDNDIPFYVVAPTSTIDLDTPTGDDIPIEERDEFEVSHVGGEMIVPDDIEVFNPAFDITPNRLVAAIVTEYGVVRPPYEENLRRVVERAEADRQQRRASVSG